MTIRPRYSSVPPPAVSDAELQRVVEWFQQELDQIAHILEIVEEIPFQVRHTEPERPRTGLTAYADGTDWNPGSGEGLYTYMSTAGWTKL